MKRNVYSIALAVCLFAVSGAVFAQEYVSVPQVNCGGGALTNGTKCNTGGGALTNGGSAFRDGGGGVSSYTAHTVPPASTKTIQEKIKDISKRIQELKEKLAALKAEKKNDQGTGVTVKPAACGVLLRAGNTRRGQSGAHVKEFQGVLVANGFLKGDEATGYFGPRTEEAIKQFQEKHGIVSNGTASTTGYGMVGVRTRAALHKLCSGTWPDKPVPPPVRACTEEAKICSDGSSVGRTGPNCSFALCPGEKPVACTKEYVPVCGQPSMPHCTGEMMCPMVMPMPTTYSNKCMMEAAGATLISQGACSGDVGKNPPKACTREYRPVCGQPKQTDPNAGLAAPLTYSNKCTMEAAEATFISQGACDGQGKVTN